MPVHMKFKTTSDPIHVKVAVIGAGVSGIYSAWRLAVDGGKLSPNDVSVFEFGNRVGGRLETIRLPVAPQTQDGNLPTETRRAEVGGMRYMPEWQLHVTRLIEHLSLVPAEFPM